MDQFPDGAHVRLRSRDHGGYLHADEDGRRVSLSLARRSSKMEWAVMRRILDDGSTTILLHSAAHHGRYLAASSDLQAPRGLRVFLAQGDYDDRSMWKAVRLGNLGYVLLLHHISNRLLCAAGLQNGVCIDVALNQGTTTHWNVETIAIPRPAPAAPLAVATEEFPDGARLRLRNGVFSRYLFAGVDRYCISLSRYRGSINTAWTVRRVVRNGVAYVAFRGDAYGRYIAIYPDVTGRPIVHQRVCLSPVDDVDILWVVIKPTDDGGAANVLLWNGAHHEYLEVGIEFGDDQWLVELI